MGHDEIAALRALIIKVFEDHPSLATFSLSCLKDYVDDRALYASNVFGIARYGDMILHREEFILPEIKTGIDETGTE